MNVWVCVRREIHFVLTVACVCSPKCALKDRSIVSGDEVMCATCAIMSSTKFGHGLVKAEPGYPFSVVSKLSVLLQTQVTELKGPEWLNEQS